MNSNQSCGYWVTHVAVLSCKNFNLGKHLCLKLLCREVPKETFYLLSADLCFYPHKFAGWIKGNCIGNHGKVMQRAIDDLTIQKKIGIMKIGKVRPIFAPFSYNFLLRDYKIFFKGSISWHILQTVASKLKCNWLHDFLGFQSISTLNAT